MYPWMWHASYMFPFMFGSFLLPLAAWLLVWTGLALWYAARRGEKWWFIVFLFVHAAGILEILYLLFVVHILDQKPTSKASNRRK